MIPKRKLTQNIPVNRLSFAKIQAIKPNQRLQIASSPMIDKLSDPAKVFTKRGKLIVIIDRDPFQREVLKQQLTRVGYRSDIKRFENIYQAVIFLNQVRTASKQKHVRASLVFVSHYAESATNSRTR